MSNEIAENLVGVDELLQTLGESCVRTAARIEEISNSSALGASVRYVVPQFRVSVKLSFTKTGETVKGILFWKRSEGASSETLSEIEMNITAVPREPQPPPERI